MELEIESPNAFAFQRSKWVNLKVLNKEWRKADITYDNKLYESYVGGPVAKEVKLRIGKWLKETNVGGDVPYTVWEYVARHWNLPTHIMQKHDFPYLLDFP